MRCWWWTAEANASTIDRADESFWLRLISDHGRLQGQDPSDACAWRTAVAPRTSGRAIEACATGPPRARSHDVVLMARTDLVARRSTLPTEAWASSGQPRAGMQLGHRRRRHHHRRRRHHHRRRRHHLHHVSRVYGLLSGGYGGVLRRQISAMCRWTPDILWRCMRNRLATDAKCLSQLSWDNRNARDHRLGSSIMPSTPGAVHELPRVHDLLTRSDCCML